MADKMNAVALRPINHNHGHHPKGSVIEGMSPGQFADWKAVGLVREATAEDLKPAGDDTPGDVKPASRKTA